MGTHIAREAFAQLFPFFGLGDEDEVQHILGDEAEGFVVVGGAAAAVTARGEGPGSGGFVQGGGAPGGSIGSAGQQGRFDGFFKILFRDCGH